MNGNLKRSKGQSAGEQVSSTPGCAGVKHSVNSHCVYQLTPQGFTKMVKGT